jgi:DNA-binding GntR family transcriptional regulator
MLTIDDKAGVTRTELVYREIRRAIIELKLKPGDRLSEAEIARQLGVSRQPVREAFIKLSHADLVAVLPQRGTLVRLISTVDVENAHFVREAIEVAAVRKAVLKADKAGIETLREIVARQAATANLDHVAFMKHDDDFHEAIARIAGTGHAWRVLDGLKAQLDRVRFLAIDEITSTKEIVDQHGVITDAIEARSPQRAEDAIRAHMSEILASLPKLAAAHAELFSN